MAIGLTVLKINVKQMQYGHMIYSTESVYKACGYITI